MRTLPWFLVTLALGCGASTSSTPSPSIENASAGGGEAEPAAPQANDEGLAVGAEVPDFPTTDPSYWVNGDPVTLAAARENGQVVLVEAWHRL